jgi:hypothetical protein
MKALYIVTGYDGSLRKCYGWGNAMKVKAEFQSLGLEPRLKFIGLVA